MPRFSAFTPCGVLRLSAAPSPGKLFYDQLKQLYGGAPDAGRPPFDLTQGTHLEASIYAKARSLARLLMLIQRAGDQYSGLTAYELIPLLEGDLYLTPGPNDSYVTRQRRIDAATKLIPPNNFANVVSGLTAILGDKLLGIRVAPHGVTRVATPVAGASQGCGHYADVRVPMKLLKLVDPVVQTGSLSYVAYQNFDTSQIPVSLSVGDFVVVQAENSLRVEVVQVQGSWSSPPVSANGTATTQAPPSGTPTWGANKGFVVGQIVLPATPNGFWFQCIVPGTTGSTEPTWPPQLGAQVTDGNVTWVAVGAATVFSATFQRAHDIGASLIVGNVPLESSTQRFCWIGVAPSAASDRETRRQVDAFMARQARAVSSWAIVSGTSTGPGTFTAGPLSAGDPIGATPVDADL